MRYTTGLRGRRAGGAFVLLSCVWLSNGASAEPQPGAPPPSAPAPSSPSTSSSSSASASAGKVTLEQAVAQLIAEARELDELETPTTPPIFTRPHPLLAGMGGDMAGAVLDRMADKFTDNEYRDSYIRWHLVDVVRKADEGALRQESKRVIRLINQMPGPLQLPLLVEYKDEPQEISRQWHVLLGQTRTVVGYPPFERVYWAEAALSHMPPERRAKMPAILKEMERLLPLWKRTIDQKAITRNDRIRRVNWIVRQYRGELIYALLLTGDPTVLPRAVEAIGRSVKKQDRAAFDILSFFYLAAFDGVLKRYPADAMRGAGEAMEALGRSAEGYKLYKDGDRELSPWAPQRDRNFADYAFHLAHMLQGDPAQYVGRNARPGAAEPPPDAAAYAFAVLESDEAPAANRARPAVRPEDLSIGLIREATKMAVDALYRIEPRYTFPDEHQLHRVYSSGRWGAHPMWQETIHEMGNHALACWGMLAAGESYQDPRIRRRLNWVLSGDAPFTYDRGMRAQMLARMPRGHWAPWVRRDAIWFTGAVTDKGNFGYQWIGAESTGVGDHANGQYGVLGLWGVQHAGHSVANKGWEAIDTYWRSSQIEETGGWSALSPADPSNPQAGLQKTQTSGPMTAGGVMVLSLTDRYLHGPEYLTLDGDKKRPPHLQRGLDWLDQHFSLEDKAEAADFFYYMWTIQSVGHASGYRTFNNIDWYRQVTARLLSLQNKDGTWEGSKGKVLSTGFALLYLARANAPLAVAKVRFDGRWNNRPHDLLNFVEWASDEYEVPVFWQIVEPDQPLHELIEARILYLASDQAVNLSTEQIEGLRRYIEAGGLLVMSPEGTNAGPFLKSSDELAKALFGDAAEFAPVPAEHWVYNLHNALNASVRLSAVHNGVRPLIIRFQDDAARDLQAYDLTRSHTFPAFSNFYLFVTGKDFARSRLETNFIAVTNPKPTRKLTVARVRHGGTYDPEPYAMRRVTTLMANKHDTDLQVDLVEPQGLSQQHRIAFLSATGDASLDTAQAEALGAWLKAGGTLWVDGAGGGPDAARNAHEIADLLLPDIRRTPLASQHPIISGEGLTGGYDNRKVRYRPLLLLRYGAVQNTRLLRIDLEGRPAMILSGEDLTAGVAGLTHWGIYGYTPQSATQLVINGILAASAPQQPPAAPQPPPAAPPVAPTAPQPPTTVPTSASTPAK